MGTSKADNAATKSDPSSGKSSLTNTESTPPEPSTETLTCSWRESTSTTTKPLAEDTCPEPSSWTWSPAPWTPSALVLSDSSSDPTTSSSDRLVQETTGPRDTTPRELS